MKKQLLFFTFLFSFTSLFGQVDRERLAIEIRKLAGEWLHGFKNTRGAIKSDSETEAIYHSRMRVTASKDSGNLIHFIKDRHLWSYTIEFDPGAMTSAILDSVIKDILFSFGNMKIVKTNIAWSNGYVPASKKGASEKIRCFYLLVIDRRKDPADKTGGGLSLTIGEDDYFRSK
jgi:hypothetical protein